MNAAGVAPVHATWSAAATVGVAAHVTPNVRMNGSDRPPRTRIRHGAVTSVIEPALTRVPVSVSPVSV